MEHDTYLLPSQKIHVVAELVYEDFDAFFRAEYRQLLSLGFVLTGNRALAEDLAQDAFEAALRRWRHLRNPSGWIRTYLVRRTASAFRRRRAERRAHAVLAAAPSPLASIPEPTHEFWAMVRRLPGRQAHAVVLHYLDDRPTVEVAAILGCSEATVRVHLHRARKTLSRWLETEGS